MTLDSKRRSLEKARPAARTVTGPSARKGPAGLLCLVTLLALLPPACSLNVPFNPADPASREFLMTRLLICLLDPVCSHRLVLVQGPGAGLGEGTLANLQTGQTKCFSDSIEQPCTAATATHPGQDGAMRKGLERAHIVFNDSTVGDRATGLIWQRCQVGLSGAACGDGTAVQADWPTAMALCQSTYGADWRLPTIKEHATIWDAGRESDPRLNPELFPNYSNAYTSTENGLNSAQAVWMGISGPVINRNGNKANTKAVHCVTGTSTTVSFTDHGDGTVTDKLTTLVWQKCARGQANDAACTGAASTANWTNNLLYCDGLVLGGRDDWRLPNRNELLSLLAFGSAGAPQIDATAFPNTDNANPYDSSTSNPISPPGRLFHNFYSNAVAISVSTKTAFAEARCVAGPG